MIQLGKRILIIRLIKLITLNSYNYTSSDPSDKTTLNIPDVAKIDGKEYDVKFKDDCSAFFYSCYALQSVSIDRKIDTSNVTNMNQMFTNCKKLKSIDMSGFNTSNVVEMFEVFGGCSSLQSVRLNNFSTSKVTTMCRMFEGCSSLANLDLSGLNTSKVVNMSYMFNGCSNLSNLNISNFTTQNVTEMEYMFADCNSLTNVNLSGFNTENVTNMERMFYGCSNLKKLDLSEFDMSNVARATYFLQGCENLRTIIIPLSLSLDIELPDTFVSEEDHSYEFTSLPKKQSDSFTIIKKEIFVTGIDVSPTEKTIIKGNKFYIIANIKPANAGNKNVIWTSSNSSVATVDKSGQVTGISEGVANITAETEDGGFTAVCKVTVTEKATAIAMYRLYNPNTEEHFYTSSTVERDHLDSIGWDYEGVGWNAPEIGTPVYRLYNPNIGTHHYTTDANEKDTLDSIGWNYEGVGWFSSQGQETPLYRLYNPNSGEHHYTMSTVERDYLDSIGWDYEGIAWYGLSS